MLPSREQRGGGGEEDRIRFSIIVSHYRGKNSQFISSSSISSSSVRRPWLPLQHRPCLLHLHPTIHPPPAAPSLHLLYFCLSVVYCGIQSRGAGGGEVVEEKKTISHRVHRLSDGCNARGSIQEEESSAAAGRPLRLHSLAKASNRRSEIFSFPPLLLRLRLHLLRTWTGNRSINYNNNNCLGSIDGERWGPVNGI